MRNRILLLLLLLLALPAAVLAHGGGTPQLVNEPAGSYWISAWSTPDPARVGQLHLTLAISEPGEGREAGLPVLGADVGIRLEPGADVEATTVTASATNANSTNKLFYEADLELPAEGAWQVQILVEGPDGPASASFPLEVVAPESTNWALLGGGGVALVIVLFALFSWRQR